MYLSFWPAHPGYIRFYVKDQLKILLMKSWAPLQNHELDAQQSRAVPGI